MASTTLEEFLQGGGFTVVPPAPTISEDELSPVADVITAPSEPLIATGTVTQEDFLAGGDFTVEEAPTPDQERPGFIERFSSDLENRKKLAFEIQGLFEQDEISFAEGVVALTGKVGAGTVLDFLGEAVVSGVEGLSAITPDMIEDPIIDTVTKAAHLFLGTDIGKAGMEAAQAGMEAWNEFKAANPRSARMIESVVDIGLLIAPVKAKPRIKAQPTMAGRAAAKVEAAGVRQTARQKADFIDKLVSPKSTAKVRTEQVARTTEEGIFRKKKVALSAGERVMADEVSLIEGVGSSKTILGNFTVISQEVTNEAKLLKDLLKKNDVIIPRREFAAELDRAIVRLGENPLLVGDAATTATKVVDKMKQIVASNPGTASGLLKSRKELDRWIETQKPKVFDPNQETALSIAVREIRQSTNDFIDARAVNVGVKDSLKKQTTLLRAMDNIGPKAAAEADTALLRAWQSANKVLSLKGAFNQTLATAFGVGGLGAAAMFAPFLTKLLALGAVTLVAGKAVLSPSAKKGVSKLLKVVDKALRTSKDEALIAQLRLDRAAIVELLEQSNE